ncbi:MAG: DUF4249 domain-containing protein [Daejeonella sp.]
MKVYRYIPGLVLTLFVLTACTKEIELNFPEHGSALVLNGVFNPDSIFSVELSSNRPISSNADFAAVLNASVMLFRDGNYLTDLTHSKDGIYRASIKPESLKKYEIRVRAPGFANISAHSTVPASPVVSEVKSSLAHDPNEPAPGVIMSLILSDPPAEENFYSVQAYTFDKDFKGNIFQRDLSIEIISPIEEDFSRNSRLFFSDKLFEGRTLNLSLHLSTVSPKNAYLRIAQVSREYYMYGKTYDMHHQTDINISQNPVSNNIENGMGVFAGYNAVTFSPRP